MNTQPIQQAKAQVRLEDYVRSRANVEFKRIGNTVRAKECPFCASRKGFNIAKEHYKCFSCGERGDVVDFEVAYSKLCLGKQISLAEAARVVSGAEIIPEKTTNANRKREEPSSVSYWKTIWEQARPATERELRDWLESQKRQFGELTGEAVKIALSAGLRMRYYSSIDAHKIIVPIKNCAGTITGIQAILPNALQGNGDVVDKVINGKVSGSIFWLDQGSDVVFVVESVANALALASIGYSAACIFSASNWRNVKAVKNVFPNKRIIMWLDYSSKGQVESLQKQAMQNYRVEGIWFKNFPKIFDAQKFSVSKDGYDVNDLLIQCQQGNVLFADMVKKYLNSMYSYIQIKTEQNISSDSLFVALRSPEKNVIIKAPTGAGKSYHSAVYFIECIQNNIPVLYVAANLSDQDQFVKSIETLSGLSVDALRTTILRGSSTNKTEEFIDEEEETENAHSSITENNLGVVTHQTYLRRKGISHLYFSVLNWVKKTSPIIVIDECDDYCDSLTEQIQIGGRYKKVLRKGAKELTYEYTDHCPAFAKSGCCSNCHYGNFQELYVNRFHIPQIRTQRVVKESEWKKQFELQIPNFEKVKSTWVGNILAELLDQTYVNLYNKEYQYILEEGKTYNEKDILKDMVDHAYLPTISTTFPMLNGKALNPNKPEDLQVITENKDQVKFPAGPCGIQHYNLKDKSVLVWLKRYARSIRFLTGTITDSNRDFLQEVFEISNLIDVKGTPTIDQLLIVGLKEKITFVSKEKKDLSHNIFTEKIDEYGKVLIFQPKKASASLLFDKFPNDYPVTLYIKNHLTVAEKLSGKPWTTLITHSRGQLKRGINMPAYNTAIVDAVTYKPKIAIDLREMTEEECVLRVQQDRITTIIQNLARIMRLTDDQRSGKNTEPVRKVFVIHNLENRQELEYIKSYFSDMVKTDITTQYYQHDQDAVKADVVNFLATGEARITEQSMLQKAIEKGLSSIPHKQRDEIREELEQHKQKEKLHKLEEKVIELAKEGYSWRDVCKKAHLERHKEYEEYLQELYKRQASPKSDKPIEKDGQSQNGGTSVLIETQQDAHNDKYVHENDHQWENYSTNLESSDDVPIE